MVGFRAGMSVATSVVTSFKLLVVASTSSKNRGPHLSPIIAWNMLEMLGYLSLSKLNVSLVFLALFAPLSRTRKVIMTKSRSLPILAPGNVQVFPLLMRYDSLSGCESGHLVRIRRTE